MIHNDSQDKSYYFLHYELVGSVDTFGCCYLHGLQSYLFGIHCRMGHQGTGCTLSKQSSTSYSNYVIYFDHVPCSIQFNDQVLIYHQQSGLQVPCLFSSSPLFGICDATFQGLLWIFSKNLFKAFEQIESICSGSCESTKYSILQFPNLFGIGFESSTTIRNLSITNDRCHSIPFQGQYGRMMPFLCRKQSPNIIVNHLFNLNYLQIMINHSQDIHDSRQYENRPSEQEQKTEIINTKGIHNASQLILIAILIMLSTSVVIITGKELYHHSRYMRTYCNLYILGNNDMSPYEDGLNIDEQDAQYAFISDMADHLLELVNITESIKTKHIAHFQKKSNKTLIKIQTNFYNKSLTITQFTSVDKAIDFLHLFQYDSFRQYLLNVYTFRIDAYLGDNKYVQDYVITATYNLHSFLMLNVDLEHQFTLRDQRNNKILTVRTLERSLAVLLLVIYFYRFCLVIGNKDFKMVITIAYQPEKKHLNLQKIAIKYRNWYIFLIFMNIVIIFESTYAPVCSFLQILPIFQFPERQEEAKEGEIYNLNKNIRFSLPFILSIFFQLLIFLNGFVFFSMLVYPGFYFDDYFKALYSYLYQLYQVGTYEIFTDLQRFGKGAQIIYAFMYFYVFEVGNALIPALFVILIQMRITQKEIKSYTLNLLQNCVCPNCLEKSNRKIHNNNLQIMVFSPTISALVHRKKLKSKVKQGFNNKQLMMIYIGDELPFNQNPPDKNQYEMNQNTILLSSKINQKLRILSDLVLSLRQEQELQITLLLIEENIDTMTQ